MNNIAFISFSIVGSKGGPGQESKAIYEAINSKNNVILGSIDIDKSLSVDNVVRKLPFGKLIPALIDKLQKIMPRSSRLINESILDLYLSITMNFNELDMIISSSYSPRVFKKARAKGIKTLFYAKNALNFFEVSIEEVEKWNTPMKFGEIDYLKSYNNILNYTDVILSLNKNDKKWLKTNNYSNIDYYPINIGVDVETFSDIKKDHKVIEKLKFIFMGASPLRKGLNYILKYWIDYDVKHDLLVCGLSEKDLAIYSKKYNHKNIKYKGFINPCEEFKSSDVYFSPSLAEGQPRATFEAMASGLVVIATEIGCGYHITDKLNGIILGEISDSEISKAIKHCENNNNLTFISESARKLALEKFNNKEFGKQFSNIIESM